MKKCNSCKEQKPLEAFYKDRQNKTDGRYSICKACKSRNVEKWRKENRAKYNADMRRYRSIHFKRMHLQRYKITPESHAHMLLIQNNLCAICSRAKKLVIDHCHATGLVRGLLCHKCNRDISILDNIPHLQLALEYLKK